MNWFNFFTPDLRSENFSEATEEQLGAWFRLVIYCCEQENGGMVHGAEKWSDRKWLNSTGVSSDLIKQESPLWHFSGVGSLCVDGYPMAKELEVKAKRTAGKRTASLRWGKSKRKKKTQNSSATSSANSSATSLVNAEGEGEGEGEYPITPQALRVIRSQK